MNSISDIIGTSVALVTPFNEDYSVDYTSLEKLLNFVSQKNGVEYITVLGTTGESATLTLEEKNNVLQFIKDHNTNKLPIVYGIGGNNTQSVIATFDKTDFTGVHSILSVSPYYNKPSQEGLFKHFTAVADACPVPVIVYNVPSRTGANISAKTVLRLANHPNIIGIKEASGDLIQCMDILKGRPANFELIAGDDLLAVPMISLGAIGSISVLPNIYPFEFSEMIRAALKGDYIKSKDYLFSFLEINPLMYSEGNPVGIKAALAQKKLIKNVVRLPLDIASEELQTKINSEIQNIKFPKF